ncbi:MAG: hypothetical protein ACXWC3_10115 [Burkholderiales bacterium]
MKRASFAALILTMIISSAAQAVLFQLAGSAAVEAVDEAPSFSLTISGITATLTANVGELNTTVTSGFGINAPGSADDPSHIDAGAGIEFVTILFNRLVRLDQIVLSDFTGPPTGDLAALTIDGLAALTLNPTAPALDVYNFSSNNVVPVGQSIILAYQAGNGFSFDSFSVTAIPEPATGLLLILGLVVICGSRYIRVQSAPEAAGGRTGLSRAA